MDTLWTVVGAVGCMSLGASAALVGVAWFGSWRCERRRSRAVLVQIKRPALEPETSIRLPSGFGQRTPRYEYAGRTRLPGGNSVLSK